MIECVSTQGEAIERLKRAFRACPKDFDLMQQEIEAGRVSVYHLTGERFNVVVAGEVVGESYFLWGLAGRGMVDAVRELRHYVEKAGLSSISADTHFKGVAKLCRALGINESQCDGVTSMKWEF
ncbi:DNAase [Vibrio agarivorans]|uniref:DNAase n=1 Tax=Vibrio agarivorans TaxID=153622 RepID=A0ABT7XZC1_9VIBR|nr:DNAase [Vibrio agarivorans]MDN2481111.1 DNAase [Vibrio agarivorans]